MSQSTIIYHNPRCSKSRKTLELLREKGIEPQVIEYLKNPLDSAAICEVLQKLDASIDAILRDKESKSAGLLGTETDDEKIAMLQAHPEMMQRPIVVHNDRACIARPPENVLKIL